MTQRIEQDQEKPVLRPMPEFHPKAVRALARILGCALGSFSQELYAMSRERGLTGDEEIKVSTPTVYAWAKGDSEPGARRWRDMCDMVRDQAGLTAEGLIEEMNRQIQQNTDEQENIIDDESATGTEG